MKHKDSNCDVLCVDASKETHVKKIKPMDTLRAEMRDDPKYKIRLGSDKA